MNHQQYDTEFFDSEAAFQSQEKPTLAYRVGHKFGSIFSKLKQGTQAGSDAIALEMHSHLEDIASELYAKQENVFTEKAKKLHRRYLVGGIIASLVSFFIGAIAIIISFVI